MLDVEAHWDRTVVDVAFKSGHQPSLRRQYLSATFFGAVGRNIYFVGASWVLVDSSRQAGSIAVFLILGCFAEFLSSKPAGQIADHVDRRLLCALCDIARLLIMLGVSGGLLLGWSDYLLYASVAVYSIIDRIYLTAMPAIIPSLVGEDRLLRFNALSYIGMQTGNMVAAAAAGVLLNVSPGAICFLFAAAAFLLSLISMVAVGKADKVLVPFQAVRPHGGLYEPSKERRRRLPLTLIVSYALTYIMGMLISILASVFVLQELSGNAVHFGLLEAGWALGAIIGAALLTAKAFKGMSGRAIPLIVALLGIVLAALFLIRRIDLCIVGILLLGAGYNVARVLIEAELQRTAPSALLGRAKGELHLVCTGVALLLYLVLAAAGRSFLPSTLFLAYGTAMVLCAIICIVVATRRKFTTNRVWLK